MSHSATADCPRCGAEIVMPLEYEPPERNWGADRDGNRGMYIPGFWFLAGVPERCPEGCLLSKQEQVEIEKIGNEQAEDYARELAEDEGPDPDDSYLDEDDL